MVRGAVRSNDRAAPSDPSHSTWDVLSDEQRGRHLDWLVDTCLLFGATRYTAYSVAALFARWLDDDLRDLRPESLS